LGWKLGRRRIVAWETEKYVVGSGKEEKATRRRT
jgi:hypothetical protein